MAKYALSWTSLGATKEGAECLMGAAAPGPLGTAHEEEENAFSKLILKEYSGRKKLISQNYTRRVVYIYIHKSFIDS